MKRKADHLIVHCTDSLWGNVDAVRRWHIEKGWKDIGYHFVILNGRLTKFLDSRELDGDIQTGRFLDGDGFLEDNEVGAHALGYNSRSIGVALIGVDKFTEAQFASLAGLCRLMGEQFKFPMNHVLGHCETPSGKKQGKTCPNFDMKKFRKDYLKVT
jgi:N-acetylmuramoyl-L-alanine amidase